MYRDIDWSSDRRSQHCALSPASEEPETTFATPFSPKGRKRERERRGSAETVPRNGRGFGNWTTSTVGGNCRRSLCVTAGVSYLPTYLPIPPSSPASWRSAGPLRGVSSAPAPLTHAGRHPRERERLEPGTVRVPMTTRVRFFPPAPLPLCSRVTASFRRARATDRAPRGNRFWSSLRVPGIRRATDRDERSIQIEVAWCGEKERERDRETEEDTARVTVQDTDYRSLVTRRFRRNNVCRSKEKRCKSRSKWFCERGRSRDFFFFFFFLKRQYGRDGIKIVITTEVYDSAGLKTILGLCDGRKRYTSLCRMFLSPKSSTILLRWWILQILLKNIWI